MAQAGTGQICVPSDPYIYIGSTRSDLRDAEGLLYDTQLLLVLGPLLVVGRHRQEEEPIAHRSRCHQPIALELPGPVEGRVGGGGGGVE